MTIPICCVRHKLHGWDSFPCIGPAPAWLTKMPADTHGDGFGSGYGYGAGFGSGDGYGDGFGSGDGDGDGYGSGDGDGRSKIL